MNLKYKVITKKVCNVFLSLIFIIILFGCMVSPPTNPRVYTQLERWGGKQEDLAIVTQKVKDFTEPIKRESIGTNKRPEDIIDEVIQWKSDYENYGLSEYWATPDETIEKESGDCEDISILKLAINKVLNNDDEYLKAKNLKRIKSEIKHQPNHVYVVTNGNESGYIEGLERNSYMEEIIEEFWDFPLERKFIFILGSFFIIKFLALRRELSNSQLVNNELVKVYNVKYRLLDRIRDRRKVNRKVYK